MPLPRFSALRSQSGELLHLDLLRFIAASGIVFHHSKEFFYHRADQLASWRQSPGLALFVDLFFVISGYVIAHVYANRMGSKAGFAGFMQRRIARLIPLHWLTMAVAIAVWLVLLQLGLVQSGVLKLGVYTESLPSFHPACLAETALLVQVAVPCGGESFNGISWSINAEMAMYVAFPLFCAIGHFRRALPLLLGLAVLALSLAALRFGVGSASVEAWTGPDLHPYLRALPSFLIGVGLWFLREPLKRIPAPRTLLLVAILALFAAMLTPQPAPLILALAYLTTVLAISSDLNGRAHRVVRTVAPLGQLTYSVYMWHPLIIMLVLAAVGDRLPTAGSLPLAGLALATYVAILGWSYLSFTLIETPARRWVDGAPPFGRRPGGRSAAPAAITLKPPLAKPEPGGVLTE